MVKKRPYQIATKNSSLYFNGHLLFLYCTQLVIRIVADNAQLYFPLSILFIVVFLAHTVIDCFAHSLLCPPDPGAGHEQNAFLTTI